MSMTAYGDTGPMSSYEYDHFVPLELGGAVNDPRNLWPEPGASPNPKDAVENRLNQKVCDGQMTLARAQHVIVANWTSLATPAPRPSAPTSTSGTPGAPGSSVGAHCTVSVSYNGTYRDYDVYVRSNQADATVTVADAAGHSDRWHADSSGYADVFFHGSGDVAGQRLTAHVGAASCSTTL